MSISKLFRGMLDDKYFDHPFCGGLNRNYNVFERRASIEDGLEIIERRDVRMHKKDRRLVPAGKSQYIVEYRIPKGFDRSEPLDTLAQAIKFYKAHAFDAIRNYKLWAESGLKSSEI